MKRCVNCGKENPDSGKFCGYCGKALPEAAAAVPPPPTDYDVGRASRRAASPQSEPLRSDTPIHDRLQTTPPGQASRRVRPAYPTGGPVQARMAAPPQSSRQRLIVIGAAALVLVLVIICAVVVLFNRDLIQDAVTGIIDPSARQTQIANDIQMGLTQTAAVNIDIPATVQAQIALTQAAAGGQPAPVQNQPAPSADSNQPVSTTEAPPSAPGGGDYVTTMTEKMKVYNETMIKVNELLTAAQADANKISDTQWQADLAAATALIKQNGAEVRQLTPPGNATDIQPIAVKAADSLDNAMELLTEYLTSKNADMLTKAVEAKTEGMASVTDVQNKISALPPE